MLHFPMKNPFFIFSDIQDYYEEKYRIIWDWIWYGYSLNGFHPGWVHGVWFHMQNRNVWIFHLFELIDMAALQVFQSRNVANFKFWPHFKLHVNSSLASHLCSYYNLPKQGPCWSI